MFTKRFRFIITAMLLVSMTTLTMPTGIVFGATTEVENQNKTVITATNNRTFVRAADALGSKPKVEAEVQTLTVAEQETLKKIFGATPTTSQTVILDGGTTITYFDKDGKKIGSYHKTTGTQYDIPGTYSDKDGKAIKQDGAALTPEEQEALTKVFGVTPVRSVMSDAWTTNSIPPSSGNTISYYDKTGNYIGKKVVFDNSNGNHTETYFDKDGKAIKQDGAALTPEEQEALTKVFGVTPVRSVMSDAWTTNSIPPSSGNTISYYDKTGNYIGKKVVFDNSNGNHTETYFDKDGKKIVIASSDPVVKPIITPISGDEQKRLTEIFGVAPVKSETIILAGGTTVTYFDKDGNKIGSYHKTTGTQMDIPGVYRDKNGNVIETSNTEIKPPVRPPDTQTNIAVWTQYYKDYLAYIGKLTDLTKKKEAWATLGKDILSMSKAHPELISANAMNAIVSALTNELKKTYADDSYKLDLSAAQGLVVDASLNFIKSGAFKKMDDAAQMGVAQNFMLFAIELSWRSANNTKNESLYPKIAEFFKTMLGSTSAAVQATSFNQLVHLYCIAGWQSKEGNAAVAQQILKDALNIAGGIEGLVTGWIVNMNSASLSAEDKARVANALAVAIWQQKALNNASTVKVSDAALSRAALTVTTFLTGVNDGTTTISGNIRNNLIHTVGAALMTLVNLNQYSANETKALANEYISLAHDSLTLGTAQGGSITVQTSVINVLTNLMARAEAKNVDTLAQRCQNVLLDEGFDVSDYITKARTVLASTKNADYGAWLAKGLANIGTANLKNNTGKIAAGDVLKIVGDIKAWVSDADNLKGMRNMYRQASLFDNLASFLKEVYAKGSTLGTDANVQDNVVAIFKTISGLKDSLVKKMANADVKNLAVTLRANGFTELASKLINLI